MTSVKFEGSLFYPAGAAVCIFATTSAWISALCGRIPTSPLLDTALELIVGAFFIAALCFSTIGAFSLSLSGEDGVGALIVRGRRVSAPPALDRLPCRVSGSLARSALRPVADLMMLPNA